MLESLENRQMMSIGLSRTGTLVIDGTGKADIVELRRSGDVLSAFEKKAVSEFVYAHVRRVAANLVGGDDTFIVHGGISRRMTIQGGSGDDDLRGGSGADMIFGSDGNDHIVGGAGTDTVDGGSGKDRIDAGDDPLDDPYFVIGPPMSKDVIQAIDASSDAITYGFFDELHVDAMDQLNFRFGIPYNLSPLYPQSPANFASLSANSIF